jgi:DNA polymerase-1
MRENKLARDLGITKDEALALMEEYMATYPAVSQFYESAIKETEQTGYSFTIIGRRRYHPEILSNRDMERFGAQRQAVNNQIQGGAADVVRFAQLGIDAACLEERFGCRMLLQVHDELVFECPKETVEEAKPVIRQLMEHPFFTDLAVPLDVSLASGPSWMNAK